MSKETRKISRRHFLAMTGRRCIGRAVGCVRAAGRNAAGGSDS